jgi:hypothetical protein
MSPADKDLAAGFDPTKPVEDQKFDMGAAFRWDFQRVIETDGTILLRGWENSVGATAERCVAELCGREVYLLQDDYSLIEAPPMNCCVTWRRKPEAQPVIGDLVEAMDEDRSSGL